MRSRRGPIGIIAGVLLGMVLGGAASAQGVSLNVWFHCWGFAEPVFREMLRLYQEEHPGVETHLQLECLSAGQPGFDKLITTIAAGTPPDVVTLGPWVELAEQGMLEPLDVYLNKTDLYSKFHPALWEGKRLDGKIYSIPAIEGGPGRALLYNRAIFAEAGVANIGPDEVITWDELGQYAIKIAKYDDQGALIRLGFYPGETGANSLGSISASYDVDWYDWEAGQARLDRPELVAGMDMMRSHFFQPWGYDAVQQAISGSGMWTNHDNSAFATGVTGSLIVGYWAPGELETTMPNGDIGVTWAPNNDRKKIQTLGSWGLSILAGSRQKDAAWDVIQFLASPVATRLIYDEAGWLGGLHRDLPRYIDLTERPGTLWYVQSLERADRVRGGRPNPYSRRASVLWSEAYDQVMSGEAYAQAVLTAANRVLNAEIAEQRARAQ